MEHLNQECKNTDNDDQPPPVAQQTTTFIDLNEDCILKVLEWMAVMDVCTLAETCTRFQEIVRRALPKNLGIRIRKGGRCDVTSIKYSDSEKRPLRDTLRILKTFGSSLYEVQISSSDKKTGVVLDLVAKNCVNSLESLKCSDFTLSAALTLKLKPIFGRLKLLELYSCLIVDFMEIVDFDSLIELTVRGCAYYNEILKNNFPKLERFDYRMDDDRIVVHLPTFLSRHTKLKSLAFKNGIPFNPGFPLDFDIPETGKKTLLEAIGNHCKELEELNLELGEDWTASYLLQPLQELQSLKIVVLWCIQFKDVKFLASLTELRELSLNLCELPTDPSQYDALVQLTKLHLRVDGESPVDVVNIVRRLSNLEEFQIYAPYRYPWLLDEKTFAEVVAVVRGRPNVLTLKCKFDFVLNSKIVDPNGNVRLIQLG